MGGEMGGASEGSEDLNAAVFHHRPQLRPQFFWSQWAPVPGRWGSPFVRRKAGVRNQARHLGLKGATPLSFKSRTMFLLRCWGLTSMCRDLMAAVGYEIGRLYGPK